MKVTDPISQEKWDEETHMRGVAAQREKIARIRDLSAGGMSRRRLIDTYGQDVVDLALARA